VRSHWSGIWFLLRLQQVRVLSRALFQSCG